MMNTLTGCTAQTVERNPALTKDCKWVDYDPKVHKEPRQRDVIMVKRGLSLAECTARMRKLRK